MYETVTFTATKLNKATIKYWLLSPLRYMVAERGSSSDGTKKYTTSTCPIEEESRNTDSRGK